MYDRTKSVPNLQGNKPVSTDKVRWVEDNRNNLNRTGYLTFYNQKFPSPDKDGSPHRMHTLNESRSLSPSKFAKLSFNMQSPVKKSPRNVSQTKQMQQMFNQVSPDSPFKRYRITGDGSSSENELEVTDPQPYYKDDQRLYKMDKSALNFSRGNQFVDDPTDQSKIYNLLREEELRDRKKLLESSPWKHHTPFQALIEARHREGREVSDEDIELSKKIYNYHKALEEEERAMRERKLQEQMLAQQNYEQFLRKQYYKQQTKKMREPDYSQFTFGNSDPQSGVKLKQYVPRIKTDSLMMDNDKEVQVPTPQVYNSSYPRPTDASYLHDTERDRSPLKQLLNTSNIAVNQGSQL